MKRPLYTCFVVVLSLGVAAGFASAAQQAPKLPVAQAFPRDVRTPVEIDTTTPGEAAGATVATDGDLTVILYEDDDNQTVHSSTSDGRGLVWSTPVRVDSDTTGADKITGDDVSAGRGLDSLFVSGDRVYAIWGDERNGGPGGAGGAESRDLYFARSLDRGASWETDLRLDKGYAPGLPSPVTSWNMAVVPDPAGDHIYVLMNVDPDFFSSSQPVEMYLVASHDNGATFGPAARLSALDERIGYSTIAADQNAVHIGWNSLPTSVPTALQDVFTMRSLDNGATFGPVTQIDGSGPLLGTASADVLIALEGSLVAIAWREIADIFTANSLRDLHVVISTDGGVTFGPDNVVGEYTPGGFCVLSPAITISNGRVVVAWSDDRTDPFHDYRIYVASTGDAGATWTSDILVGANGSANGTGSELRFATLPPADVFLSWSFRIVESVASRDDGQSWTPRVFEISGDADAWLFESNEMVVDPLYRNTIHTWIGFDAAGEEHVFAGGYRPARLVDRSVESGDDFAVRLRDFSGVEPLAWVLFSSAPGDFFLPFGDGRNLGLSADSLFLGTLAAPATFLTALSPEGAGQTATFPVALAAGTKVHAAAVSFALAPVQLAEITDVETIEVR